MVDFHSGLCSELCALSHISYVRAGVNQERSEPESLRHVYKAPDVRPTEFQAGTVLGTRDKSQWDVFLALKIFEDKQSPLLKSVIITSHFIKCTILLSSFSPFPLHTLPSTLLQILQALHLKSMLYSSASLQLRRESNWSPCGSFSAQQTEGALQDVRSLLAISRGFHHP